MSYKDSLGAYTKWCTDNKKATDDVASARAFIDTKEDASVATKVWWAGLIRRVEPKIAADEVFLRELKALGAEMRKARKSRVVKPAPPTGRKLHGTYKGAWVKYAAWCVAKKRAVRSVASLAGFLDSASHKPFRPGTRVWYINMFLNVYPQFVKHEKVAALRTDGLKQMRPDRKRPVGKFRFASGDKRKPRKLRAPAAPKHAVVTYDPDHTQDPVVVATSSALSRRGNLQDAFEHFSAIIRLVSELCASNVTMERMLDIRKELQQEL